MGIGISHLEASKDKAYFLNGYKRKFFLDDMWSYGKLVGFDLETTGLDIKSAIPVSYAFCTFKERNLVDKIDQIVNPGIAIPIEATRIHGITTDRAVANGVELKTAIGYIYNQILDLAASNVPLVGMNLTYDLTIVELLSRKLLGTGLQMGSWTGPVIDVLIMDRFLDKYRSGSRNLASLCNHYEIHNSAPHQAFFDAKVTCEITFKMADKFSLDEIALDELFDMQRKAYLEWATSYTRLLKSQNRKPLAKEQFSWPIYDY